MTDHFHAVVCIDHAEALVFEIAQDDVSEHRIRLSDRHGNIHHKAGSVGSGHAQEDKPYFQAVAEALQSSHEILIVGHGTAKTEFGPFHSRGTCRRWRCASWASKPWIIRQTEKSWRLRGNSSSKRIA